MNANNAAKLKNSRGQALLIAIFSIALFAVIASVLSSQLSANSAETAKGADLSELNDFITVVGGITNDYVACFGTNLGLPRVSATDPTTANDLSGLRFYGQSTATVPTGTPSQLLFDPSLPTQWVTLGLNTLSPGGPRMIAQNGTVFPSSRIRIDQLYLGGVSTVGTGRFAADLMVVATSLRTNQTFAPRAISRVTLSAAPVAAPFYQLSSCQGAEVAASTCASMGCTYRSSAAGGLSRCTCGYPDTICGVDASGDQTYLTGYDTVNRVPVCKSIRFQCAAGLFFAGFDQAGAPICFAVETRERRMQPNGLRL